MSIKRVTTKSNPHITFEYDTDRNNIVVSITEICNKVKISDGILFLSCTDNGDLLPVQKIDRIEIVNRDRFSLSTENISIYRNIKDGMVKDIYLTYASIYIEGIYLATIPIVVKE